MKPAARGSTAFSITVLFSAYSEPSELIAEAAALARQRRAALELVAFVPPQYPLLFWIGACVAPVSRLTPEQLERDVVSDVARMAAAVPADVSVRWRLLFCGRRRATRRLFGGGGLRRSPSEASSRCRAGSLFVTGAARFEEPPLSIQRSAGTAGTA